MTKTTLGVIIALICSVSLVGIFLVTKPKTTTKDTSNTVKQEIITKDEVAKHTSATDCWTSISGKVYDISEYVRSHPGGSEILRACGKDATAMFNTRRDDGERIGSGTPHSSSAHATLENYQIGTLSN